MIERPPHFCSVAKSFLFYYFCCHEMEFWLCCSDEYRASSDTERIFFVRSFLSPFLTHWSCLCLIPLDSGPEPWHWDRAGEVCGLGFSLCVTGSWVSPLFYKYVSEIICNPICLLQLLLTSWERTCRGLPILNNSFGSRGKISHIVQYVFSSSFMYKVFWFFLIFPSFHIAVAIRYLGTV